MCVCERESRRVVGEAREREGERDGVAGLLEGQKKDQAMNKGHIPPEKGNKRMHNDRSRFQKSRHSVK